MDAATGTAVVVSFRVDRVTKNTVRFEEELAGQLESARIGTLYVPKSTLAQIGYQEGDRLAVELKLAKP